MVNKGSNDGIQDDVSGTAKHILQKYAQHQDIRSRTNKDKNRNGRSSTRFFTILVADSLGDR